jgi:hypothetical protein
MEERERHPEKQSAPAPVCLPSAMAYGDGLTEVEERQGISSICLLVTATIITTDEFCIRLYCASVCVRYGTRERVLANLAEMVENFAYERCMDGKSHAY